MEGPSRRQEEGGQVEWAWEGSCLQGDQGECWPIWERLIDDYFLFLGRMASPLLLLLLSGVCVRA